MAEPAVLTAGAIMVTYPSHQQAMTEARAALPTSQIAIHAIDESLQLNA